MPDDVMQAFRPAAGDGRWSDVGVHAYKQEGTAPFKDITRQVLFSTPELGCELRYFEMAAGGHSTLERHEHVHAVTILRGHGHCLVGDEVRAVGPHDLVYIPPLTWHQFRATGDEPMGFLCMVNAMRDKPQLPIQADRERLAANPKIAAFLSGHPED